MTDRCQTDVVYVYVNLCPFSGPWPFYKMAFKAMNEANKNAECMPLQLNMYLLKWLETYLRQMCALCEDVFGECSSETLSCTCTCISVFGDL